MRNRLVMAVLALAMIAAGCARSGSSKAPSGTSATTATASVSGPTTTADKCKATPLQATEVGVTDSTITIETMADVGSPLAPGLFQGNLDGVNAFADAVNKAGGIACRKVVVKTWDTKLSPTESKNGLIDACSNALALVGNNALFDPDVTPMTGCVDKAGAATGLPNLSALSVDINEQCAPTTFSIQAFAEKCPVTPGGGPRPQTAMTGPAKYYLSQVPGLHGTFLVPGDLPTTVQSAVALIQGQASAGIVWDATPKVSGADAQPAYTPRVQLAKAKGATYIYDGSNDTAFIRMRKESKAQGLDSVKIWACSLACYTKNFISQGGADVEGTYMWMQFLPFEEASSNPEAQAYVSALGSKVDSFGAQAWQAAVLFRQVINDVVAKNGVNGITRANLFTALKATTDFTANGWAGKKDLRGFGSCFMILQVQSGKYVRVYPKEVGTFDCNPSNLVTMQLDPVAEAAKIK